MPDLGAISDQRVIIDEYRFLAPIFTAVGNFYHGDEARLRSLTTRSIIPRLAGIAQVVEQPPCKR